MVELKVVQQHDNKIIGRKEIVAEMPFEGPTPSSKDVQNWIAKQFKTESNLVVVDHVYTKYGITLAIVHAKIYDKLETAKILENIKEEKPKEESKQETKTTEEKPAQIESKKVTNTEHKKEEAKQETKTTEEKPTQTESKKVPNTEHKKEESKPGL